MLALAFRLHRKTKLFFGAAWKHEVGSQFISTKKGEEAGNKKLINKIKKRDMRCICKFKQCCDRDIYKLF